MSPRWSARSTRGGKDINRASRSRERTQLLAAPNRYEPKNRMNLNATRRLRGASENHPSPWAGERAPSVRLCRAPPGLSSVSPCHLGSLSPQDTRSPHACAESPDLREQPCSWNETRGRCPTPRCSRLYRERFPTLKTSPGPFLDPAGRKPAPVASLAQVFRFPVWRAAGTSGHRQPAPPSLPPRQTGANGGLCCSPPRFCRCDRTDATGEAPLVPLLTPHSRHPVTGCISAALPFRTPTPRSDSFPLPESHFVP